MIIKKNMMTACIIIGVTAIIMIMNTFQSIITGVAPPICIVTTMIIIF